MISSSTRAPHANVLDYPRKSDDREWFERNQKLSHRARPPFPGEVDEEAANTPAGQALIILVRQVQAGSRLRTAVVLNADLQPLPDDESVVHALFDLAMRREAMPRHVLCTLIEKYTMDGGQNDA